jgi:ketosteroid isomerase-like protein
MNLRAVKLRTLALVCLSLAFVVVFVVPSIAAATMGRNDEPIWTQDDRDADRQAIKAHIESIFQAFIDWDVDKIYATHAEDWRGFLEGSRVPIKGIDEYMKANGIDWPKEKGSKPSPDRERTYQIKEFDVIFYGPELAVASFIGEFARKSVTTNRLQIMDVYAKRKGNWIQVASHTVVDPAWHAEQTAMPKTVSPEMRQRILTAREAVWKAFFSNDRSALERLIPEEAIAIDDGSAVWSNRAEILASAKGFADSGAKLVKLEFPKTEMQVYGNTVILYTTYLYEIEANGQRTTKTGRGTEMFVYRNGTLVNSGWHLDSVK